MATSHHSSPASSQTCCYARPGRHLAYSLDTPDPSPRHLSPAHFRRAGNRGLRPSCIVNDHSGSPNSDSEHLIRAVRSSTIQQCARLSCFPPLSFVSPSLRSVLGLISHTSLLPPHIHHTYVQHKSHNTVDDTHPQSATLCTL